MSLGATACIVCWVIAPLAPTQNDCCMSVAPVILLLLLLLFSFLFCYNFCFCYCLWRSSLFFLCFSQVDCYFFFSNRLDGGPERLIIVSPHRMIVAHPWVDIYFCFCFCFLYLPVCFTRLFCHCMLFSFYAFLTCWLLFSPTDRMVIWTGCMERQPRDTRMGQRGHSCDRYAAQVNCCFFSPSCLLHKVILSLHIVFFLCIPHMLIFIFPIDQMVTWTGCAERQSWDTRMWQQH